MTSEPVRAWTGAALLGLLVACAAPRPPEHEPAPAIEAPPPFSAQTVVRLNAIVARSLEAIEAYDREAAAIRSAEAPSAEGAAVRDRLVALHGRARAAHADMTAAVHELDASGERYDPVVLGGMVAFVEAVDAEIGAAVLGRPAER